MLTNAEIERVIDYLTHTQQKFIKHSKGTNAKRIEEIENLVYKLEQMKEV